MPRIREIKDSIAQGEIEMALKASLDLSRNFCPDFEDDTIQISANYYRVLKDLNMGHIKWETGNDELKKTPAALLFLLKLIAQNLPQS